MFTFQLGRVTSVYTSKDDFRPTENEPPDVGKILFTPQNLDPQSPKLPATPLLRGMHDSIHRGDAILFSKIGTHFFYIGPLNLRNDLSKTSDTTYNPRKSGGVTRPTDLSKDNADGSNVLYPKHQAKKLEKPRQPNLDFPAFSDKVNDRTITYYESNFSDFMLQGRFSNAIRIGARNENPSIVISNNNSFATERLGIGSLIAMLSNGTLDDNFPNEVHTEERNNESVNVPGYRLSADNPNVIIGFGNDNEESLFNYGYAEIKNIDDTETNTEFDQIILTSDRIIFDSKQEDITISSNRNINFGANKNFTLNNKGFSVFQSQNIYIGEAAKQRTQPMVLGNELQQILVRILRLLADAQALGDMNVPQGLTLFPNIHIAGTLKQEVENIMQEFNLGTLEPGQNPPPEPTYEKNLDENGLAISDVITGQPSFLSDRHFIESNRIVSEE